MGHPTDPLSVFGMLCYKNGGAARQAVRDERCGQSWEAFDEALRAGTPGNEGIRTAHAALPTPCTFHAVRR